jgi:hypothetical protein
VVKASYWVNFITHTPTYGNAGFQLQNSTQYDAFGRPYSVLVDGHLEGGTSYNGLGQVTAHEAPTDAGTTNFVFEAGPGGRELSNRFNGWPREVRTYHKTNQETVVGLSNNNLFKTIIFDENNNKTEIYTDYFGRKRSEWRFFDATKTETDYYYDDGGNIDEIVQPNPNRSTAPKFTFTYDGRNRLDEKTIPDNTFVYAYEYEDNSDRLSKEIQPLVDIKYEYTDYNELEYVKHVDGGTTTTVKTIVYGTFGIETGRVKSTVTKMLESSGQILRTLTYDKYGRVKTEAVNNTLGYTDDYTYHYDMADNVTMVERDHDMTATTPSQSLYLRDSIKYDLHSRVDEVYRSYSATGDFYKIKQHTYEGKDWLDWVYFYNDSDGALTEFSYDYNERGWVERIGQAHGIFDWPKCSPDTTSIATICNPSTVVPDTTCGDTIVKIDITLIYDGDKLNQCLNLYGDILFKIDYKYLPKAPLNPTSYTYSMHDKGTVPQGKLREEDFTFEIQKISKDINYNQMGSDFADSVLARLEVEIPTLEQCLEFMDHLANAWNKLDTAITEDCEYEEEETTANHAKQGSAGELGVFGMQIFYNQGDIDLGADPYYNGNISHVRWNTGGWGEMSYGYCYDQLDRLIAANFQNVEWDDTQGAWFTAKDHKYSVPIIEYDHRGNITKLLRSGVQNNCDEQSELAGELLYFYGMIDDLLYNYGEYYNKVWYITEAESTPTHEGFHPDGSGVYYQYDDANNVEYDPKSNSSIRYNKLNLPYAIGGHTVVYDADGVKYKQTLGSVETYYVDGLVYENNKLEGIYFEDGRHVEDSRTTSGWRPEIFYRDHLGSVRAIASDTSNDGRIRVDTANNYDEYEVLAIFNYYPFGMLKARLGLRPKEETVVRPSPAQFDPSAKVYLTNFKNNTDKVVCYKCCGRDGWSMETSDQWR